MESPFFRGAVSGLGAVTLLAGLAEVGGIIVWRRARHSADRLPDSGTWKPDR